jgi:hypothetical protein
MDTKSTKSIEAQIPVLFFEEGGQVIAYSPVFDLSTCGDTEEKARSRFTEALRIFLSEISAMGTLDDVLEECGWRKVATGQGWHPPVYKTTQEAVKIPVG